MTSESNTRVAENIALAAQPRVRSVRFYRLAGLLAAAGVTAAAWLGLLLLAGLAFGFAVTAEFAMSFTVVIAVVAFVVAAIVTTGD